MKTYLLFLLGLISYAPTVAQTWRIGPTVGGNLSTISFSNNYLNALASSGSSVSTSFAGRWQLGAQVDYEVNDQISIRSGLLYSTRGCSYRYSSSRSGYGYDVNGSFHINYLDLPLLVTVAVGQNGFRLVGGPVLSFALSGKTKLDAINVAGYSYGSSEGAMSIGSRPTDSVLPTDFSFSLGAFKQFNLNERRFELGVHVQPSLSSFAPTTQQNTLYTATHFQLGLRAAYFFDLSQY